MPVVAAIIAAGKWKGQVPVGMSPWRALATLNGRPMLAYIVDALAESTSVTETILVAPPEVGDAFPSLTRLDATDRLTGNVLVASRYASGKGSVLLVGSDIPLITAAAIDGFVRQCASPHAEFYYSIIEKAIISERYPMMSRTYVRLADGTFTGGNLMLADPRFLLDREGPVGALYDARKSPAALARFLGWPLLIRLVLTVFLRLPLLDVPLAEKLVGKALKGSVAGVKVPYPEIGADLDREDEIPVYESLLAARSAGQEGQTGRGGSAGRDC